VVPLEIWHRIRHLAALGWSQRRIARELQLSRNTVAAALAAAEPPCYRRSPAPSPLQPWQARLEAGLRRGLRGSRVLDELRQAGYTGSRAAFYARWRALAAAHRAPPAACRFETGPGEQAQFDWAEYVVSLGGVATKVYVYSLLLCFSRRVHWFPSLAVDFEAVTEALEAGLRHFGGGCRFLLVDNARVFVGVHRGSDVRWNAGFLRLAGYYRFAPIAGTPRHPQGKGKVENPFGHLEQLFLVGRAFRDWGHFEAELSAFEQRWEQRVHGTTKVSPAVRFAQEQEALLPLPPVSCPGGPERLRQVSHDCLISFAGVRYSVPWALAGQQVLAKPRQGRELVVTTLSGEPIAQHELRPRGSPPVFMAEHYAGLRRRHQACLAGLTRRFREEYGPAAVAEEFLRRLLTQHRHHPERPLAQVLDLLSVVPTPIALAALADAVEFQLCTPRFLEARLQQHGATPPERTPRASENPAGQLTLPRLDIERSLHGYGRALD
jgi:transposase